MAQVVIKWNFSDACEEYFPKYIRVDFERGERWDVIDIIHNNMKGFINWYIGE